MTESVSTPPRIRPENIKILCVDSDGAFLEVLERVFKFRAYNTTLRKNGQEALDEIDKNTYDIILCDLNLSDMSGIDVLEHFKKLSPEIHKSIFIRRLGDETINSTFIDRS